MLVLDVLERLLCSIRTNQQDARTCFINSAVALAGKKAIYKYQTKQFQHKVVHTQHKRRCCTDEHNLSIMLFPGFCAASKTGFLVVCLLTFFGKLTYSIRRK